MTDTLSELKRMLADLQRERDEDLAKVSGSDREEHAAEWQRPIDAVNEQIAAL